MKPRTYDQLMRLEIYAHGRWVKSLFRPFWHRLAVACSRAVKAHPEYRGAR